MGGGGSAGRAPTLYLLSWHLPYNARKIRENLSVVEGARLIRTRFIYSTWSLRAMASTALLVPAVLIFRVSLRVQPSDSVSIYRVSVLWGSPHQPTVNESLHFRLCFGRQRAEHPDSIVSACYSYQRAPVGRRRHLDCNTCSFRTWDRASNLPVWYA